MKSLLFKITHGGWNAELQLAANHTLEHLAYTILEAVGFEADHAFGFYDDLKNPYRSKERYSLLADEDDESEEGSVQNTLIGEVFQPKKKMIFLFDYGDDWLFLVHCTAEKEEKPFKKPKILSTSGEAPVQYPDHEEES
ncbi:MAG: plasmid pRiA4b ORF-3 family protein [Akkermansiaceae bacterium]|nr:plasmid pRiA4b ORF-3 family protein [Akkermansiaceae bacterium]